MEKLPHRTAIKMTSTPDILIFHLSSHPSNSQKPPIIHNSTILINLTSKNSHGHKLQAEQEEKKIRGKEMASTSAVSMAMPLTHASQKRAVPRSDAFFRPLAVRPSKAMVGSKSNSRFQVQASLKEKAVTGLTAAALTASMVMPDVAEAAELSPSLKNFLLSIVAGGVVLVVIFGAVIGVANFDPVKRS